MRWCTDTARSIKYDDDSIVLHGYYVWGGQYNVHIRWRVTITKMSRLVSQGTVNFSQSTETDLFFEVSWSGQTFVQLQSYSKKAISFSDYFVLI